ncbi:MAG TPA: hypothetical protein VG328_00100 [Stellaceae bacterium]|nr:hypothetical protein [Stellaceae bacterium]
MALLLTSGARAADRSSPTQISDLSGSGDRLRAVVSGLRQSLADHDLSQAVTRASDWVKDLEVSWTAHLNGHASNDIDTATPADMETAALNTAAAATGHATFSARPESLNLGLVSFGTSDNDDQVWALGHAQPLTSLTTGGNIDNPLSDHSGTVASERALISHDLALGLRVPMMPWNATIAGDHYWWGVRGFGPHVEGTRVALKFSPMKNVEIEGGHASDTRGSGGFIGLRYSVALDQPK